MFFFILMAIFFNGNVNVGIVRTGRVVMKLFICSDVIVDLFCFM